MQTSLTFVFVLASVVGLDAQIPPEVLSRIVDKERIVNQLANEVADLFQRRSSFLHRCPCSRHSCSNDITDFHCTEELGNVEAVCGVDCEGRNINFNSSAFRTPPNTDINQLSPRVKESICLYSNLEPSMKELVPAEDPSWVYFGGTDGVMRIYPASPRQRGVENGDEALGQCRTYDPRIRPWFIGASTRPKDIVFVIDRSRSMDELVDLFSSESRWDITSRAVVSMLGTLASFDYVNVVAFSGRPERLYTDRSLLQGTKENLDDLIDKVEREGPHGQTNFDAAFQDAFRILTDACDEDIEQQPCSRCQKIILFLTDGRDTSQEGESIDATEMLSNIEGYQRELERVTSKRAAIFTFSMGDTSDDSIPRQIACANNGSWSYIGPETDPLTAMNNYYHFLTSADNTANPVWINPYEDDGGLGLITTVSKPVYSQGTSELEGVFLGVVGLDVLLSDLEVRYVQYTDVLREIIQRSRTCDLTPQNPCQLQVNRNAYANEAICADNISPTNRSASNNDDPTGSMTCYRGPGKFYKLFSEQVNWDEASQRCQSDRGRLVVIESPDELAFVAGVSSPDGSWISARRIPGARNRFEWTDSEITNDLLTASSASWGVGEPNNFDGVEDCVHIDRRGVSGNLNDEDCSTELSFICEYTTSRRCDNVVQTPSEGYFEIPPLSECVHEEESLANARPLSAAERLSSNDVMCPLGPPRNSFDAICCDDCGSPEGENNSEENKEEEKEEDKRDDSSLGLILAITIPGAFVIVVALCMLAYRARRPNTQYPEYPLSPAEIAASQRT